jgi:hypothetical protein
MIWGVLSIVAGALMAEGGVMEVIVYWPQGQISPVVVGALGAVASAVLLVSGVAFCTGRSFGRRTALAGAIGMAPVHLVGWLLGIVGVPGVLLGVAYPTTLLLVLRAKPGFGAPSGTGVRAAGNGQSVPSDHTNQRAALSGA